MTLGKNQKAALQIGFDNGRIIAGQGGDASWATVDSLRKRGLIEKTGRCANELTDAGRETIAAILGICATCRSTISDDNPNRPHGYCSWCEPV